MSEKMNKKEKEIIDAYFNDPMVKNLMEKQLGPSGKVIVDWEKRTITARGNKASKHWDMDDFLSGLITKN